MEQRVTFYSGNLKLEGYLNFLSSEKAVIVTHPHPLYGGDMSNMVVELLIETFKSKGFSTLRFNFRGVGGSQGHYSDGIGEVKDVCAAAKYLKEKKFRHLILAGYSFGAWINASVKCDDLVFESMVMVSPPVAFMDFAPVQAIDNLSVVVTGSLDEIAPPEKIEQFLSSWNPSACLEIIDGADHFYWNHFKALDQTIAAYI
ncbi:MAG: alpha/beta hydrolase [Desulfobacterales bacterium]